ncbi:hypothetical protein CIK05_15395 [Bdellovibrio sp. qaytius]|nr:hypothetical protein CIK05_15395 [Bdellovibrio sp. qaytius]
MRTYQQSFINLLKNKNLKENENDILALWQSLPVRERASLFIDTALLITLLRFVQEQYWILNQEREEPAHFGNFVKKYFKSELSLILFLHATLESSVVTDIEEMRANLLVILKVLLPVMVKHEQADHIVFATECLKLMVDIFEFEQQLHNVYEDKKEVANFTLDRTFDALDIVFNLDYKSEMQSTDPDETLERIFQGSGVGVQSSYNTIIMALNFLRLPQNARLTDLGSGFGRVGLVISLLRPDIKFIGYEFVASRVDLANAAVKKLGIDKQLFFHQDLSLPEFKIPDAEVYYLFDPFTQETYSHVIAQLNQIASQRKIMIVTKGNAREQFMTGSEKKNWSAPQVLNYANFCLFRSRG